MSHADSILNYGRPCINCGEPRGNRWLLKCPACSALEGPVTEADIERILNDQEFGNDPRGPV